MLRLEIRHKARGSELFESPKSKVFVGRDRSMDIVLDDPLVSRQHAVIISRGSQFVLQDIGGRNAVRVNGAEVISHSLSPGDAIQIGETVLVFNDSNAAEQRAAADFSPTVVDARKRKTNRKRIVTSCSVGSKRKDSCNQGRRSWGLMADRCA